MEGNDTLALLPRRAVRVVLATLLALVVGGLFTPPALAATPGELETCFLNQINAARNADGTRALAVVASLSEYGRTHSSDMADAGYLFHSGSAQIEPELPSGWQAWGENVGYATGSESCDWLFEGFWESPNHRANLLNPIFDSVGIGVIIDPSDTIWTTHVFFQSPPPPATTTTTTTTLATSTTTVPVTTTTAPATTPSTTTTSATVATSTTTTSLAPTQSTTSTTDIHAFDETTSATTTVVQSSPASLDASPGSDDSAQVSNPTQVAGVGTPCAQDCSDGERYAIFLGLVAAAGLAISWWAFRS